MALVPCVVDAVNADRSRYEQIKRFTILPRDFTMEHDELTPTLKLKRRVVAEHFGDQLDELYEGEELPPPVEQRVLSEEQTIGRNDPCWCGSGKKFKKCHGA